MDGMERNQDEMGKETQWDNTYGKKSLPQVSIPYDKQNTAYGEQERQQQNVAEQISSFGPPVQPYLPPRKSHKKGIFIALGVVFVILLCCVGIGYYMHVTSPIYKIRKGFENMDKELAQMRNPLSEKLGMEELAEMTAQTGCHIKTRLNFATETYSFGDVTLGVDIDYNEDIRRKEIDAETTFSMMNFDFAHFNFHGDEEVLCFSIPELFMEDIYIETGDLAEQYNNSIWADSYLFDELEEEYVLDLFPDVPDVESVHSWQELREYLGECSEHLEPCLESAEIERAGKEEYRVTFDALEVNYLLRDMIKMYEDLTGQDMSELLSCLQLVSMGDDISLLIKIDNKNRIKSIVIEDPVSIMDNLIELEGEVLFSGDKNSIELLQGEFIFTKCEDDEALDIIWQVDQWLDKDGDEYKVEADVKFNLMDDEFNLKYTGNFDSKSDEFDISLRMKDDWTVCSIYGNGSFDDIRWGRSYEMDLEKLSLEMDGEELFNISGDIMVEPPDDSVRRKVKAKRAFFEMTEEDWYDILERIDEEYDYLWNMLF